MAGATATQEIMVTVEAAELAKPTIANANSIPGSGIAIVSWNAVTGASGYALYAVNLYDGTDVTSESVNDAAATSGSVSGLTVGETYLVFVVAFDAEGNFKLSEYRQITVP